MSICIKLSVILLLIKKMYWNEKIVIDLFWICSGLVYDILCFNDNSIDAHGEKLHKIRSIIEYISKMFLIVFMLSIEK